MAETKFKAAVKKYNMLPQGSTVVLGLSGGADSVALADLLYRFQSDLGFTLTAAHLNHGLRGEEADRDQRFVEAFCREREISLTVRRVNVRAEAEKSGEGEEECGRRLRYALFEELASGFENGVVATAHTLSDNLETVLLHMSRGCGLHGLCGIPPVRGNVVRPLIDCTRAEVEAYCEQRGLDYITDSTNFSQKYARNRLRMDCVPAMRSVNPGLEQAFCRMLTALREDERYLSEAAEQALKRAEVPGGYSAAALMQLPASLLNRALITAVRQKTGVTPDFETVCRICDILSGGSAQTAGGFKLRVRRGVLEFPHASEKTAPFNLPASVGINKIPSGKLKITVYDDKKLFITQNVNKNLLTNCISYDKIIGKMTVRSRLPGDSYRVFKRGCTKTLRQLFNEAGIPPEKRGGIPVLCDEKGILWVGGFGVAERAAVQAGKLVYIEYSETVIENA